MPYRFGDPGALTADDLVMAAEDVTDLDGTLTATPHPVIDAADDYREQIRVLQEKLTASEARVAASATHTHRLSAALLDSQEKLAQSQNDLATSQQRVEATPHHSQLLPARPPLISVTTVDADALREHLAETTTALVRVRAEKQALELHCDTLQQDGADLQHASRQLREAATACKSQMSAKRRENRELQKQVSKLSRSRNKLRDSLRSVQGEQSALVGQLQSAAARVRDDTRIAEHRSVHFQVGNSRMAAANGGPTHGYDAAAVGASSSHVEVLDPGLGGMVAGTGSTDLRTMADSLSQLQLRMETLRDSSSCASSVSGWSSADDTGAEAWGTQPLQRTRGYTPHTKRSGRKPASVDEASAARRMAKDLRRQSNKLG
jgi:predicted  nucleic acid-binding Zn-ribbon protein